MKTFSYFYVKYRPRVPLLLLTVEKIQCKNFDFVIVVPLSSFLFFIMHNSKSILLLRTIQTPNECTTIRNLRFLVIAACGLRSTSTGRVRTFYISNDCSTIGDAYFRCWSWMRNVNDELHLQTRITVSFL